jgi:3-methylcrotonyl-CoA carboxylase alpha subunit
MPKRLTLSIGGESWSAERAGDRIRLMPGPTVTVTEAGAHLDVEIDGRRVRGRTGAAGDVVWVGVDGEVFAIHVTPGSRRSGSATRDHDALTPPMSATVVRIGAGVGDAVKDGDVLIALEAMKMELPIRAPRDGIVRAIHCRVGDLVQPDQVLLDLE